MHLHWLCMLANQQIILYATQLQIHQKWINNNKNNLQVRDDGIIQEVFAFSKLC